MSFGEEVKRLRRAAALTQKGLAEKVGLSQAYIAQLETDVRGGVANVPILYRLCGALGVTCDHFKPFFAESPTEPVKSTKPTMYEFDVVDGKIQPAEPVKPKKGKKS
jgi:transcriptional regulator with XRE-family HTH domain